MKNSKRGYAVIFNHNRLNIKNLGSDCDVNLLKDILEKYRINVALHQDLTISEIETEVHRLSTFNFVPYDYFMILILTNGNQNNILSAADNEYNLYHKIFDPIMTTNKTLNEKPKIILIQASKNQNQELIVTRDADSRNSELQNYIPVTNISNIYYAYSAYEGHSFICDKTGGGFIQKFCEKLDQFGYTDTIDEIMQHVVEDVRQKWKETPIIQSTITTPFSFADISIRAKNGYAIIFNQNTFHKSLKLEPRTGTKFDVIELQKTFENFNITIDVKQDFSLQKINEEIERMMTIDFSKYDCLIVVVLTHGSENNNLQSFDKNYNLHEIIVNPIINNNMSLIGKPKIFIIQASGASTFVPDYNEPFNTEMEPVYSNMFFAFSTFNGHYAYRHPESGGVFIQKFCEILTKYKSKKSIYEIMQYVTRELNSKNRWHQVPLVSSTMMKDFYFG